MSEYTKFPPISGKRLDELKGYVATELISRSVCEELIQHIERLESAVRWALGYSDFPVRQLGQGQYYWRKELYRRAFADIPENDTEVDNLHKTLSELIERWDDRIQRNCFKNEFEMLQMIDELRTEL